MGRLSDAAWDDVLAYLREHHSELVDSGVSRLQPGLLESGELTIRVGDAALHSHLEGRCRSAFVDAAQAITGHLVGVRFVFDPAAGAARRPANPAELLQLHRDYLFENFVIGPENQLAVASCRAVAEAPGATYNPLFLHGPSGLGKTHLLHAICHQILAHRPQARVVYLTCETFVNEFISAVTAGDLIEFRSRFRHADLLLVDDIQFLGRGERSQEEFFHTFNTLFLAQRQIVLSADCLPNEIPALADRLVSRFRSGLMARMEALCVETRIAILRTKARVKQMTVDDAVLDYIGNTVKGNARDLEGALANVRALADALGRPMTIELARTALRGASEPPAPRRVTVEQIVECVCARLHVRPQEVRGKRRHRSVAMARQTCMYLARRITPLSLEEIGDCLGRRDHTTVLHAQRVIAERREKDPRLAALLDELEERLRDGKGAMLPAV